MIELNEDKNRDIAWAGLEENDIKAEVEASEIREMSVNRHHFKNIEFFHNFPASISKMDIFISVVYICMNNFSIT